MAVIQKIIKGVAKSREEQRKTDLMRKLMRREAQIGGELFGPIRPGGRREFFCLDKHTWVWHEEWNDERGVRQIKTTRYDVRPDQIIKSQNGQYSQVQKEEALRLREAAKLYQKRTQSEIYRNVTPA